MMPPRPACTGNAKKSPRSTTARCCAGELQLKVKIVERTRFRQQKIVERRRPRLRTTPPSTSRGPQSEPVLLALGWTSWPAPAAAPCSHRETAHQEPWRWQLL